MTPPPANTLPLTALDDAIDALLGALEPVGTQRINLGSAAGRVLAEAVCADRPSPPVDVSAMDGIAIRMADLTTLTTQGLAIDGEATIGGRVRQLAPGTAMRIFTGGPVPAGADAVVQRELLDESTARVRLRANTDSIQPGQHIRRAGEHAAVGDVIAPAGACLTPAVIGALASVGASSPLVRRRVRVAVLATGDELTDHTRTPAPTGLRDSNSPAIAALLTQHPWIACRSIQRVHDHKQQLASALRTALESADCVITSGGVSMGDHDHVPGVVRSLGGRVLFHRLAIKPGKPIFAAMCPERRLFLGLPGNAVSALVTARRIALPALAALAGAPSRSVGPHARLTLDTPNTVPSAQLTRFLLVQRVGLDHARTTSHRSSGDLPAAARSDGLLEIPQATPGPGPFSYYAWSSP